MAAHAFVPQPAPCPLHVVVIGGGVGGLVAAYELMKLGHRVSVYEAAPVLGGLVRTFQIGGGRIEAFYHHLFRSDEVVTSLIEELDLGDDLEWVDSRVGMLTDGRIYPFVSPFDLLYYRPVSLMTRLRLGLAALWLRRATDGERFEGQRARDWIVRKIGSDGYEKVWGPLLRTKFGRHADQIAMPWFWSKISLRFASRRGGWWSREQLGYLRGSFGRLVDALALSMRAGGVVVEQGRAALRVVVENGVATGVELASRAPGDAAEVVPADAVLVTTANHVFTRLVPELDPDYRRRLEAIVYQWATVLILALDRPLSDLYWLTITDPDFPFVAVVEQTNFRSPAEYGGHHVVYFSNYADPGDPVVDENETQVLDRYAPYIARINPSFTRDWIRGSWLFKDRAGQPILHHRYREIIPPHRTNVRGLYLANNTQLYPEDRGQNHSMRMGIDVARQMVADLASPPRATVAAGVGAG